MMPIQPTGQAMQFDLARLCYSIIQYWIIQLVSPSPFNLERPKLGGFIVVEIVDLQAIDA